STTIAVNICLAKKANVRYFIPHRFRQGYGLHMDIISTISQRKCDLVIVVDCGSQDVEEVALLKEQGVPVIIFDHHLIEAEPAPCDTMINPQLQGDFFSKKLCATGVIWCWALKSSIISEEELYKCLDLVALATIADCVAMSSPLNRALVKEGLKILRTAPRPGLFVLMEKLGIVSNYVNTEDLAMKVIPCLNATGRLYLADLAVKILFPCENVSEYVDKIIFLNKKRKELSSKILSQVEKGSSDGFQFVLMNEEWSAGVLSSVASRVCFSKNTPVALVAANGEVMRGTLRMPNGGNAVEILKGLDSLLLTWGGHKLAAGFSVKMDNWRLLRTKMEEALSKVTVVGEKESLLYWNPTDLNLDSWQEAEMLGPFGLDNPKPQMYFDYDGNVSILPLGKTGRHVKIETGNAELLGFGAAEMISDRQDLLGWAYTPRFETWRNFTSLQFVLDKMIVE
ncbi:MAG: DHHA1 domain-containing protein, partial [Synergistaceae bacterium]